MKRFYGFNNKTPDAEWHDGVEFATDSIPEDEWDKIADEKGSGTKNKMSLFTAACMVLLVAAMLFIETLINKEETEGFDEILFHPVTIVIYFACLAIIVFRFIKRINSKEEQRAMGKTEESKPSEDFDAPFYNRLGVPDDAKCVDILCFEYDPDGEIPTDMNSCLDSEMKIYKENESLCLADTEKKYEIPLSQLRRIKAVNKEIGMILWNKKESFRQSPYSAYNIVKNKKGNYVVPKYYELEFEHEGELWLISFPCYEIDTFQKLTGLTAEY